MKLKRSLREVKPPVQHLPFILLYNDLANNDRSILEYPRNEEIYRIYQKI